MPLSATLPGGSGRRFSPAGVRAGAPLSRIQGADDALRLVAVPLAEAEHTLLGLVHSDVAAVPTVAGYLAASGGKRLRPALTALGALTIGFEGRLPKLMCVGELIHLGSLLHDDVVDEGELRRGKATAHRVYGNAVTILTGDFCLARAVWLASEEGGHLAVTALARAVTEMAEGEVLQLQREGDLSCGRAQYFEVINKKSAALIAWSCAAAAYAAGDAPAAAALEKYGRGVGVAFQIADDILDYHSGTGKNEGIDLQQRKVTLPLLYAFEHLPQLRATLEERPLEADEIDGWIRQIRACGALEQARADARREIQAALEALEELPEGLGREALGVLGEHLVERVR